MKHMRILSVIIGIIIVSVILIVTGCFGSASGSSSDDSSTVKPKPTITKLIATTSGTEEAYYTILDIKVKNEGAEGTVLVQASVTQSGTTNQREMAVYLMQGETHELKLTFPLKWEGGDFTPKAVATVP
jgi:hypothetical protein